ncbi:hypothetical protein D0862_09339 [Hortaea werneckii]|uniref:Uncharacterized protein n=1 Tax=Hortaea werneckii TaxID=91943 RepID=A0A3M7FWN7_HORWE|nr:hypothetical protein D0862_09339 [Hortaea werneckii]
MATVSTRAERNFARHKLRYPFHNPRARHSHTRPMASHVPFLAVRPDDQFSADIKTRDFAAPVNGIATPAMENAPIRVTSASRIPAPLRYALICVLSLGLNAVAYTLTAEWAGVELAAVSPDSTEDWRVWVPVAWKLVELTFAGWSGYDWKDLAGLACLSNLPYYFLLHTFYEIHLSACLTAFAIDVSSIAIPFALLRPISHAHTAGKTANQLVAHDPFVFSMMAIFGSAIYAVTVYSSLYTWLPVYMITRFDEVRSLQSAHDASVWMLLAILLPIGWATTQFLFTPAVGQRGNPGLTDPDIHPEFAEEFNAETATLGETVAYNLGFGKQGFSKRAEVVAKRTAVLIGCSVINTVERTVMSVAGTDVAGAAGWASVWGVAGMLTAVAYAWVGNE